jgi:hypothetical protein
VQIAAAPLPVRCGRLRFGGPWWWRMHIHVLSALYWYVSLCVWNLRTPVQYERAAVLAGASTCHPNR